MTRLVVGFKDQASSLAALRWAIRAARMSGLPLRVVHASSSAVAVRNGPSSTIAHQLGNPLWATVHSLVQGLDAPDDTETIVKPGLPLDVLCAHVKAGDVVILGDRTAWPSRDMKKILEAQIDCTIMRVDGGDPNDSDLSELLQTPAGVDQWI